MITLLLLALAQAAAASPVPAIPDPLLPLTVYAGDWTITGSKTMAGPGKDDHLVNHCAKAQAFYSCEQVVNGKSMAMIIFTPADSPNTFHTQIVLPDGHAAGRGDLTLAGNHWTFERKEPPTDSKETRYKTENYFTGRDTIHFDQYESTDGTTWKLTNSGDEHRILSPAAHAAPVPARTTQP